MIKDKLPKQELSFAKKNLNDGFGHTEKIF